MTETMGRPLMPVPQLYHQLAREAVAVAIGNGNTGELEGLGRRCERCWRRNTGVGEFRGAHGVDGGFGTAPVAEAEACAPERR